MSCHSAFRVLPAAIVACTALAACEQLAAVSTSPTPVRDAEIAAAAATLHADPVQVARAQRVLNAAMVEYDSPNSAFRASIDRAAEKAQRLAIKHSPR